MRLSALFALLIAAVAEASIFCPHTVFPSTDNDFAFTTIQSKQKSQDAYYRITDDQSDEAFKSKSKSFRMMTTRDSSECPFRGCLVELSPAEPKSHSTILYQTSIIGKMIPPGFFAMDIPKRLYCVITEGDCGANVPLYRHYKITPSGIFHAYSLDSDEVVDGYSREPTPLCYVWEKERSAVARDAPSTILPPLSDIIQKILPKAPKLPKPASSAEAVDDHAVIDNEAFCAGRGKKAFDSAMKRLRQFHNGESGTKSDHMHTTKKTVSGYRYETTLGKVVTNPRKSNCKCLVQLAQMKFESDDKSILDHKLVREQIEPPSLYKYMLTGEEIYCARESGACGATVPLRKFFNFGESDSLMTANNDAAAPANSAATPGEVICWIWPKSYHQDSTEEEVREEQMNVVKPNVPADSAESSTEVEGSGAAEAEEKPKPKIARNPKEKKIEKTEKKTEKKQKKVEKEESQSAEIEEKPIESEEIVNNKGDKVLKFENVGDGKEAAATPIAPPKPQSEEKPTASEEAEERARELIKFNNQHHAKEPSEVLEEQQDDVVIKFEEVH